MNRDIRKQNDENIQLYTQVYRQCFAARCFQCKIHQTSVLVAPPLTLFLSLSLSLFRFADAFTRPPMIPSRARSFATVEPVSNKLPAPNLRFQKTLFVFFHLLQAWRTTGLSSSEDISYCVTRDRTVRLISVILESDYKTVKYREDTRTLDNSREVRLFCR